MTAFLKKLFIYLVIIAAVLAAIPLVFPYGHYRPRIAQAMSDRLQTSVTIADISFSYAPAPHLVISNINIGSAGEGEVSEADIPLNLRNLLYINHELRDIVLVNARLKQDFATSLPSLLKPNPGHRDLHFASLRFTDANLANGHGLVGPFSGVMKFNEDGTFNDITLSDKAGHAELNIKPLNEKFSLEFSAKNWTPPGNYDVPIDEVVIRGIADQNGVTIDEINGVVFGAAAVGQAQVSWQDGWKLTGTLETKGMHAEPLITLVSKDTRATGRLAGVASFTFTGSDYQSMFKQPQLSMNFTLSDGELHNLDLIAPLRSQGASSLKRGGQTRFDSLSGTITSHGHGANLTNLLLNEGKFSASGSLSIDDSGRLNGHMNTRLASGAIAVDAPLFISGNLTEPEISSGGAYKPGGASATTQIF